MISPTLRRGPLGRALADALASLVPIAEGEVAELGPALPRRYPPAVSSVKALEGPADLQALEALDTIVSVCELWRRCWGPPELEDLTNRLRPGGRLLLVEPIAVVGVSGRVQRVARPLTLARHGLAFDRDLVGELRSAGLITTSVVRTSVDPVGRVRTVVAATLARR